MAFTVFNRKVVDCEKCNRLRGWCSTREGNHPDYKGDTYWGLPVPGFGNYQAELLIVGLAPGAHGANRTGRPFTGDTAGDFLFKWLYRHGFSNQSESYSREDGLHLINTYITNAVKCAPPDNKPNTDEIGFCREYLIEEMRLLSQTKVILALGEKAFNQVKQVMKIQGANVSRAKFGHLVQYDFGPTYPFLIGSYHTSKYNLDTKRMTDEMMEEVLLKVKEIL